MKTSELTAATWRGSRGLGGRRLRVRVREPMNRRGGSCKESGSTLSLNSPPSPHASVHSRGSASRTRETEGERTTTFRVCFCLRFFCEMGLRIEMKEKKVKEFGRVKKRKKKWRLPWSQGRYDLLRCSSLKDDTCPLLRLPRGMFDSVWVHALLR